MYLVNVLVILFQSLQSTVNVCNFGKGGSRVHKIHRLLAWMIFLLIFHFLFLLLLMMFYFAGLPLSHPNGYVCPGVLGLFSEDSSESEAVCKGDETKCINIVGYRKERCNSYIYFLLSAAASQARDDATRGGIHTGGNSEPLPLHCKTEMGPQIEPSSFCNLW